MAGKVGAAELASAALPRVPPLLATPLLPPVYLCVCGETAHAHMHGHGQKQDWKHADNTLNLNPKP